MTDAMDLESSPKVHSHALGVHDMHIFDTTPGSSQLFISHSDGYVYQYALY